MKELIRYQEKINDMDLEDLLNELEKQVKEMEWHRLSSHNETLEKLAEQKIFLIKMTIFNIKC